MHGADLPYQALQVLLAHALIGDWYIQEDLEFLDLVLWKGYRFRLSVDDTPEDLLNTLPISLLYQDLLDQYRFLGFLG